MSNEYAPGMRLNIRGEEWLLRNVTTTPHGTCRLDVVGLSPMVRDREAVFMADIEESLPKDRGRIQILDPHETKPVRDDSPYFRNARLHLEVLMRQTAPSDALIHRGHKAAIDVLPFQLEPALKALKQPRQRILIADAVGLGKTIECGILLSELIKRGRARRILVLTGKSMLKQFMKELWTRFSIPLVRLDSAGIARIRREIPSNQNPFSYYDKTIISIDTLKQAGAYRRFLEDSHWDVIVIDEAHNIAERGNALTQRAQLAQILANKSDSLILLSATPHDGRKESFASIIKLLDPTAIANDSDYTLDDVKALVVRRFKKDVRDQINEDFPDRVQSNHVVQPGEKEASLYHQLAALELDMDKDGAKNQGSGVVMLFKTMIGKTLASSPVACASLLNNRIKNLQDSKPTSPDIPKLQSLLSTVQKITKDDFSKYGELVKQLSRNGGMDWTRDTSDRVVIFTESIPTLHFLEENLANDIGLKPKAVAVLSGGMSDVEQMEIIDQFGRESSPLRLLLVSDVGSEGVNLHYCAHRLIHFDIPWSLLTFQQRNGRIDRYGQTKQPCIHYFFTDNSSYGIVGDARILECLIAKDKQVQENIGDPLEFNLYRCLDEEAGVVSETNAIVKVMEGQDALKRLQEVELTHAKSEGEDFFALFDQACAEQNRQDAANRNQDMKAHATSLYKNDFNFVEELCKFAQEKDAAFRYRIHQDTPRAIDLKVTEEFYKARVKRHFPGCYSMGDDWQLYETPRYVMQAAADARNGTREAEWPMAHMLWEQDPMVDWLCGKVTAEFGRNTAPVITTPMLEPDERIVLGLATVTNKRGVPVEHIWRAARFHGEQFVEMMGLEDCLQKCDMFANGRLPNNGAEIDANAFTHHLIPLTVDKLYAEACEHAESYERNMRQKLSEQTERLDKFLKESQEYLAGFYQAAQRRKDDEIKKVKDTEAAHKLFIRESLTTAEQPSVRIITLFVGAPL